jgi:hypothetical protein
MTGRRREASDAIATSIARRGRGKDVSMRSLELLRSRTPSCPSTGAMTLPAAEGEFDVDAER